MLLHHGLIGGGHEITSHLASTCTFFTPIYFYMWAGGREPMNPTTNYYHSCLINNFPASYSSVY